MAIDDVSQSERAYQNQTIRQEEEYDWQADIEANRKTVELKPLGGLEQYRGEWFERPDDIAAYANQNAREGYQIMSITPMGKTSIEGVLWPGVYVLMEWTPE